MKTSGYMYQCDNPGCKASQFLEEGEDITEMDWLEIPGTGLFCEQCGFGVSERIRDEGPQESDFWKCSQDELEDAGAMLMSQRGLKC